MPRDKKGSPGGPMSGKRFRIALVLASLIVAAGMFAFGQDSPEATSYEIRISLDTEMDTMVGIQEVHVVNRSSEAVDEIPFALIANWGAEPNPYLHPALTDAQYAAGFDPTWTRISQVRDADGNPLSFRLAPTPPFLLTFSLEAGLLIVELDAPLAPGAEILIRIDFETKFARASAGDNCVAKDTYTWRFGWNPVLVDSGALAGRFELPAANYHVELTIPQGYHAFGGADMQQELGTEAGIKTIELSNQRPTRSVPLIIGPELSSVSTEWNGVTIEAVYLPGGEAYAREALSYAEEILDYHTEQFGPFAGTRLIIAENPTSGFFGMAADGFVLVGASIVRLKDMPALGIYDRVSEYLLAHEIAHLWWGIGIGTDFNAENWISEGFAEYLSISYFEDRYGGFNPNLLSHLQPGLVEDAMLESMGYMNLRQHMSELPYLALLQLGFDEPIIQPMADSQYLNGITIRTYSKGYLALRALEAIIGKDTLHTILVEALDEWNGKLLSVEDFKLLAERISQSDLADFFADWIYGTAQLDVGISGFDTHAMESGYQTLLTLSGIDPIFPVDIQATLTDGSTAEMRFVPTCCSADTVAFETVLPISAIAIDPDEMLPDANRYNNHWPRKIMVDHPFRSADAPEIGKPLDAYVIDISPTGISGSFRNDHAWSLMLLPHIDPNMDWESFNSLDDRLLLDLVGVFAANIGRDLGISFTGMITALDLQTGMGELDAMLTARILGFTHPQTGQAGLYWYPSWQHTLTVGALGALPRPTPYLSLSVQYDSQPTILMRNRMQLVLGIPGFGTAPFASITWQGERRLRLFHLMYVDVGASIAESLSQDLPNEFLFSLSQLHSFDYLPMGHHQAYATIEAVFPPLVRDSGYAILNLTRLDSITPSVFIQGGRTQANCLSVCEPGIRVEAGARLAFIFPGFLGTSIRLDIGYAVPLIGVDGSARAFFELGGGF